MEKKIVGLASFGLSGKVFHAPFIAAHKGFELKYIVERSKNESKLNYPSVVVLKSYEDLLLKSEVDLIVVNTPSYLHYEMCKSALLAGKNVVVEKPFVANVSQGEELIALAKEKGLVLTVYHNKRLEGDFLTVKKLLEKNALGNLESCKINSFRYKPEIGVKKWKEEGYQGAGLLYDIGSHLIDQSLQLFGWPLKFSGDLKIQRKGSLVVDGFELFFHYKDFKVVLSADMTSSIEIPSFYIEGKDVVFVKYGKDPQEQALSESDGFDLHQIGIYKESGQLINKNSGKTSSISIENGNYYLFYDNLYRVLSGKANLLVDAEEALSVIRIIETLYQKGNEN